MSDIFSFIMTVYPLRCLEYCSSKGNAYAAPIWGDQCSCGDELPQSREKVKKKSDSDCTRVCPGDSSAMCGGHDNRINIYHNSAVTPTATPTTTAPATTSKYFVHNPDNSDHLNVLVTK